MTPEELAHRKAARLSEPEARQAAGFAARQLGNLMFRQHGVVALAQLRAAGLAKHDIERLVRYRALRRVHRQVYVDHTGDLTVDQRIWAAGGKQYRDIEYDPFGLVVELDGRLGHDSWEAENRDADRDLDDVAPGT